MELIKHTSWKSLCDAEFSADNPVLPSDGSIVFVHMEHIYQFFEAVKASSNKYILVSADSDYCLTEQVKNPVWLDMTKWFNFIPVTAEQKYDPVIVAPRCDTSMCRITDMFSIKVYAFTRNTFDMIPENIVHWYSTNCDFNFPGIEHIPFGIPEWNVEQITALRGQGIHNTRPRAPITYVNFQKNNLERVALLNVYANDPNTFVQKTEIPHADFIDTLFKVQYVVSPPGNGYDCFRTLEAIYCGCVPILVDAPWNEPYRNLPVIMTNNLSPQEWPIPEFKDLEGTTADFGYWRNRISEKVTNFRKHWLTEKFDVV